MRETDETSAQAEATESRTERERSLAANASEEKAIRAKKTESDGNSDNR
jgi:hypothetical protein